MIYYDLWLALSLLSMFEMKEAHNKLIYKKFADTKVVTCKRADLTFKYSTMMLQIPIFVGV